LSKHREKWDTSSLLRAQEERQPQVSIELKELQLRVLTCAIRWSSCVSSVKRPRVHCVHGKATSQGGVTAPSEKNNPKKNCYGWMCGWTCGFAPDL